MDFKKTLLLTLTLLVSLGVIYAGNTLVATKTKTEGRAGIGTGFAPSFVLAPSEANIKSGDKVNFLVFFNSEEFKIVNAGAVLNFDPNLLEVVEVLDGTLTGSYLKNFDNKIGKVNLAWLAYDQNKKGEPYQGTTQLGRIVFRAKKVNFASKTVVSFDYNLGATTDSNLGAVSGVDVLGKVSNSIMSIEP